MFLSNLFFKRLKKQLLSINLIIESFFNNFKNLRNLKEIKNKKNYKTYQIIFICTFLTIILILSYFLTPSFYNKNKVAISLQNQLLNQYNIEIKFNEKIKYGLFPEPHFSTKNLSIINKGENIALVGKSKVFISYKNLFSFKKLKIKNLLLKKADFKISKNHLDFFKKVLNSNNSKYKVKVKNSNLFFQSKNEEIIFLSKLKYINFYYDDKRLENKLLSNYEIFNIPFKLNIKNNKNDKKLFLKVNSDKIRLNIENIINYSDKILVGTLDLATINKENLIDYKINNDSLDFKSLTNNTNGSITFKPFYLSANSYFDQLDIRNFLSNDSLFINFIRSGILNNKNLNMNVIFKFKKIRNNKFLKNIVLKTYLEEGNLIISNSSVNWKDAVDIKMFDAQIINSENDINLIGKIIIDFNKPDKFYSSFQVNKLFREHLEIIEFDFIYELTKQNLYLDNVKINKDSIAELERFIDDFNTSGNILNNKIIFKSFVNNFFKAYSG